MHTVRYRVLYTLGRVEELNFPVQPEQRAELDALGVEGVMAAFQAAAGGLPHGYYTVTSTPLPNRQWVGNVRPTPAERAVLPAALPRTVLSTCFCPTSAEAAKAVDRCG